MLPDRKAINDEYHSRRFSHYDLDKPSQVMDKKLVINVAPTGAFIKREQNPHQAYTPAEVAKQVIEAYKVGASVFHVHVRDEKGILQPGNVPVIKETLDIILNECPDIILSHSGHNEATHEHAAAARAIIAPLVEAGLKSGRRYVHTQVLLPMITVRQYVDEEGLRETVEYLQDNNVVPEFQIDNYRAVHNLLRWVIEPGLLRKPHVINLLSGIHGPTIVGPGGPDPWGRIHLMTMLHCMQQMLPQDCVFGATIGGHNWLPLTIEAIMLGVDCIRIGMEDTMWLYPHREDRIESCAQVVDRVSTIARYLGRDIASPTEAKRILGIS